MNFIWQRINEGMQKLDRCHMLTTKNASFKFCTSLIFAPVYTLECTSKQPEKWENDRANKELNPYIHPTKSVTMLPLAIEHECEPCLGRDEGSPSKMVQLHVRRKSRAEATIVYPHAAPVEMEPRLHLSELLFSKNNITVQYHCKNKTNKTWETATRLT